MIESLLPSRLEYSDVENGSEQPARLGGVHWQHGVNSVESFYAALNNSRVHAIESDFDVTKGGTAVAFHPPTSGTPYEVEGALLLKEAVTAIVTHNCAYPKSPKIFEIDLKALSVLEALKRLTVTTKPPLIVNADVLQGESADPPLHAARFKELFLDLPFPAILSPGFTTSEHPKGAYTDNNIFDWLNAFHDFNNVIFPVRVEWVANKPESFEAVQRVLESPGSSLKFWNGKNLTREMVDWVRYNTDPERCMYDLYDPLTENKEPILIE